MVTKDELDAWEADERAKRSPDDRAIRLIGEVRRLQGSLAEVLPVVEKLIRLFARPVENKRLRTSAARMRRWL